MQNRNSRPNRPRRQTDKILEVKQQNTLLPFLLEVLSDNSRTAVKQILTGRRISINGEPTTQHDAIVKPGDKVIIHRFQLPEELRHPLIRIIWQDSDFVLVEKKPGIPTVGSGIQKDRTALRIVSNHLKQYNPETKIFMLNRLDRDSAGIILFAKSKEVQEYVIKEWSKVVKKQSFVIAIEGDMPDEEGLLESPRHDTVPKNKKTQIVAEMTTGHSAGTARYKVIRKSPVCTLVEITLISGRNNQLRRQMGQMGTPIVGDWRQGSSFRKLDCLAIQGTRFTFRHPKSGETIEYKLPLPKLFRQLIHLEEGSTTPDSLSKEERVTKQERKKSIINPK